MSSANVTIDDTSTEIIYSSERDWALQRSTDPNDTRFFSSSYHAAQVDGAIANISFTGSAIYLYGSRGPQHANYSAFFDRERILVKSSARSNELKFRQLLFQMAFNDSGPHRLSLTVVHDGANQWFDIDFVTVTMNGTALNGPNATAPVSTNLEQTTTLAPPWEAVSTDPVPDPAPPPPPNNTSNGANKVTMTLAIVFGVVISVAVFLLSLLLFCKRRYKRQRKREHAFRYGEAIKHIQRQEEMQRQQMLQTATTPATLVVPEQYRADDETEVTQMRPDGKKYYVGQALSQSSDSVLPTDPFARDVMKVGGIPIAVLPPNDGPDNDRDRPRPRSPWSMLSNAATTVLTVRSPSPQSTGTNAMLLGRSHANSHRTADLHNFSSTRIPAFYPNTRTSSQIVEEPSRDSLQDEIANVVSPLPVRNASQPQSTNFLQRLSASALPHPGGPPATPLPPTPLSNSTPRRPSRPKEGLLDWLGTGMEKHLFGRRTDRDDGNSSRTDFLKV